MTKLAGCKTASAIFLFCAVTAIASSAQLTTLASFTGPNGDEPYLATLVQGTDGNFYGTTEYGGPNTGPVCGASLHCGTLFKVTPTGTLTTLYNFCSKASCADGAVPTAGLVQFNGNFYGTTSFGGATDFGTVFEITPAGQLTTIYNFCSVAGCTDGAEPGAALILATNGNFYGTTAEGGTSFLGTVFEMTPAGKVTTLHSFDGSDGELLSGPLVQATNGNFYGTTTLGGSSTACSGSGCGTVFEITPAGTLTTLHNFESTDGSYVYAGLVQATNGNLYGVTYLGGANGFGTVFDITPSGSLTTLDSFAFSDGSLPLGTLIQATDGNLYGTTSSGGEPISGGTVFKMTPGGTLTDVYTFCSLPQCMDGEIPEAGVMQGTSGNFYGTTVGGGSGGTEGDGTVFSLATGLGPFVSLQPNAGLLNNTINILGQGLTGTTSVSFNGASAKFKVVSDTDITATVPVTATTGPVTVTTPGGKLTSNQPFRVVASVSARP